MFTDEYGREWRFDVSEQGSETTITRGRVYQLPSDWTTDAWSHYWDSDGQVAFYDEGFRGRRIVEGTDEEWGGRAITAFEAERDGATGSTDALRKVAHRFTAPEAPETGHQYPNAAFIVVHLDRGTDLYVLSWDGDPEREWRNEIEAVWNGDIWRIECEEYQPGMGPGGSDWVPADEYPEEFYGESKARSEYEKVFPLDAFPADLLVEGSE